MRRCKRRRRRRGGAENWGVGSPGRPVHPVTDYNNFEKSEPGGLLVICYGVLLHYLSSKESDRDLESSKQDIIHPVGINESDKCGRSNGR